MTRPLPAIFFRSRQSDECACQQWLHGRVATNRAANPQAEGDLVDLCPLVHSCNWCHHFHRTKTIQDFGGFPSELYRVQYPAPGDTALARRVQKLLSPLDVTLDDSWGLDHGTLGRC